MRKDFGKEVHMRFDQVRWSPSYLVGKQCERKSQREVPVPFLSVGMVLEFLIPIRTVMLPFRNWFPQAGVQTELFGRALSVVYCFQP